MEEVLKPENVSEFFNQKSYSLIDTVLISMRFQGNKLELICTYPYKDSYKSLSKTFIRVVFFGVDDYKREIVYPSNKRVAPIYEHAIDSYSSRNYLGTVEVADIRVKRLNETLFSASLLFNSPFGSLMFRFTEVATEFATLNWKKIDEEVFYYHSDGSPADFNSPFEKN